MIISLVVAAASNRAIGKQGALPWHLPADLRHFKNITWGLPIIMGRKTYASLSGPLPGRSNIVLTRRKDWSPANEEVKVVTTPEEALQEAGSAHAKEVMVIGGGEIYSIFLPRAHRIYMTRVEAAPEADTFFPALDSQLWKLTNQHRQEADTKNAFNYSFEIWERI
ncbi:MAG: dihydrofolate reductase [Sphingomonadales bacterium]